jgi:hypothetical protein
LRLLACQLLEEEPLVYCVFGGTWFGLSVRNSQYLVSSDNHYKLVLRFYAARRQSITLCYYCLLRATVWRQLRCFSASLHFCQKLLNSCYALFLHLCLNDYRIYLCEVMSVVSKDLDKKNMLDHESGLLEDTRI